MIELDNLEEKLALFLESTRVTENGKVYQILETVFEFDKIKIQIYSNDHLPPHFHIKKTDEIDAVFDLNTLEYKSGKISNNNLCKIKAFFKEDIRNSALIRIVWKKHEAERQKNLKK